MVFHFFKRLHNFVLVVTRYVQSGSVQCGFHKKYVLKKKQKNKKNYAKMLDMGGGGGGGGIGIIKPAKKVSCPQFVHSLIFF